MLRGMAADAGRTILLSSHDMNVVQDVCERVIIVNHGKIVTADRVANLLDLFQVRSYKFTIRDRLTDAQVSSLHDVFEGINVQMDGHTTTIEVELLDGARIYELIDALRRADAVIESIDRRDPNLGDIFLRIVRGEVRT